MEVMWLNPDADDDARCVPDRWKGSKPVAVAAAAKLAAPAVAAAKVARTSLRVRRQTKTWMMMMTVMRTMKMSGRT